MRGLCVERSCRENISVGWRGADHPLFDIVFDKCVNGVSVGFESILPRVAPGFHLLLHSLSQIDDRETAAVAENIVVSHLLRLLEGGVKFRRKLGMFPVEFFTHDDHVHRREGAGFCVQFVVFGNVIGK